MNISFIVISRDSRAHLAAAFQRLRASLVSGDQIIVVDDGSSDETDAIIRRHLSGNDWPEGVTRMPILLGKQSLGGIGIAANIGLDHATQDYTMFIDADGELLRDGMHKARVQLAQAGADLLIGRYDIWDEQRNRTLPPPEHADWPALLDATDHNDRQLAALRLAPTPWRKIHRTAFLRCHDIRFPEQAFPFEAHPMHWQECMQAATIAVTDAVICLQRPEPAMTMGGPELLSMFSHFKTIRAAVPSNLPQLGHLSLQWLIRNIAAHIGHIRPEIIADYAERAMTALQSVPDTEWSVLRRDASFSSLMPSLQRLRDGHLWDVTEAWKREHDRYAQHALASAIDKLATRLEVLEQVSAQTLAKTAARQAIDEFEAITRLYPTGTDEGSSR